MAEVIVVTIRLTWAERWQGPPAPHLLRGAIAHSFAQNSLFHQHQGDRLVYRYPAIHYRWDRQGAVVVGFGEGVRALLELSWPGLKLNLAGREVSVLEAICSLRRHGLVPADCLIRYRFGAPWLPFPQHLYQRYRRMSVGEREAERDRMAVAGLLTAMRGLGITFQQRLFAAFEMERTHTCNYKGVDMLGFTGTLLSNVDLPDGFALGRAVSHGYGWLIRTTPSRPEAERSL